MSNTDRIRAYYNLHRKCFSVQDYQTGLVTEHTDKLFMTNAMFVVRESGNKKVKREGRKNVHAFVNGIRSKLKQGMMPEFASLKFGMIHTQWTIFITEELSTVMLNGYQLIGIG